MAQQWHNARRSPALIYEIRPYTKDTNPNGKVPGNFPWAPMSAVHVGITASAGDLGRGSHQRDQTTLTVRERDFAQGEEKTGPGSIEKFGVLYN